MEIVRRLRETIDGVRSCPAEYTVFFRYVTSGFTSAVFQFGLLFLLVEYMRFDPTFSSGLSFVLACVVNYLMLYHWTFCSNGKHHIVALKYTSVTLLTLCVNLTVFWILTEVFFIWYILSQVIAVGVVAVFNFLINRGYTFI